MIKVGAIRQRTHQSWKYKLKMRCSLEKMQTNLSGEKNNLKQSDNVVDVGAQEKQRLQWRWKES